MTPPEQSSSTHARMTIEVDPQIGAAGVSTVLRVILPPKGALAEEMCRSPACAEPYRAGRVSLRSAPPPLLPNAIKAAWAQLHILRRVADCLVSQVELDFAQVAAFISECEPGSMPQLVGVHIWQPGFGAHTL